MGPVVPAGKPNPASSTCGVILACAVGAGFNVDTAFRFSRSKRGMACENAGTPKVGLFAIPVGMLNPKQRVPLLKVLVCACNGRTNGFKPPIGANTPAAVNRPIRTSSLRETLPCERAFTISARFLRAFSASLSLRLSLFSESQNSSLRLLLIVELLGYTKLIRFGLLAGSNEKNRCQPPAL